MRASCRRARSKSCATSPARASSSSARWPGTRCASRKRWRDAQLKITGVVSDLLGASGLAILWGLIEGETDAARLLARTTGRLRAPRERLLDGLQGVVTEHHRFLLRLHLEQIEAAERTIATLDARLGTLLEPLRPQATLLVTMPGVSHIVAQVLIAEIGVDMSRFPTAGTIVHTNGVVDTLPVIRRAPPS